uniref:Uncharacterized protein n=1 Tax=Setaria italica TaxID=4555 RepID=K3ZPM4_SETIT
MQEEGRGSQLHRVLLSKQNWYGGFPSEVKRLKAKGLLLGAILDLFSGS